MPQKQDGRAGNGNKRKPTDAKDAQPLAHASGRVTSSHKSSRLPLLLPPLWLLQPPVRVTARHARCCCRAASLRMPSCTRQLPPPAVASRRARWLSSSSIGAWFASSKTTQPDAASNAMDARPAAQGTAEDWQAFGDSSCCGSGARSAVCGAGWCAGQLPAVAMHGAIQLTKRGQAAHPPAAALQTSQCIPSHTAHTSSRSL